jgi:hypothetical protein
MRIRSSAEKSRHMKLTIWLPAMLAFACLLNLPAQAEKTSAKATPAPTAHQARGTSSTLPALAAGDVTESVTLNLQKLLADPLAERPELRWLQERRAWAARQATGPTQLEQVAKEFEAKQAYYPALEMLWLAEKMTTDENQRKQYNDQMRELQKKSASTEQDVDAAEQMWKGGKPLEALEQLNTIIKAHPYSELAYYKAGFLYAQSYHSEAAKSEKLIVPSLRVKLFRLCYEMFACTLVIDPLYVEAYEQLNMSREMLSDQPKFLQQTNVLSQVALNFRTGAQPALARLDNGDRSAATLAATADGLLEANQTAYAALLYRAALLQPKVKADVAADITGKLNKALERLPAPDAAKPDAKPKAVPTPVGM